MQEPLMEILSLTVAKKTRNEGMIQILEDAGATE